MAEQAQPKKKRARSPSYPGIGLELAIQRAQRVYEMDGRNFTSVDAIVDHWGYTKGSGPGLVTLAALKKYGLLEDQGVGDARQARLTDLALGILLDEPGSPARQAAVREAALNPPINRELWDGYNGHLPSDQSLRLRLVRDLKFTETGALEFIDVFKETIAFATLSEDASMSPVKGDTILPGGSGTGLLAPPADPKATSMPLPVAPGEYAVIQGAFPFTEEKWKQMLLVLEAMKPALVVTPQPKEAKDQG